MGVTPQFAADSRDPQRDAVYAAEECAREMVFEDPPDIPVEQLADFAQDTMDRAGWTGGHLPTFVLDIADDDMISGWHRGMTGEIHLHPKLLHPWIVLHELAHWLRPADGHGPQFCAVYAGLVKHGISDEAATELLAAYEDLGVEVDASWLHEEEVTSADPPA